MDERRRNLAWGPVLALLVATIAPGCGGGEKQKQLSPTPNVEAAEEIADIPLDPRNAGTIDGSVAYLQRIALPRGATVIVELFELSTEGGNAALVARHSFRAESQVPIRFQLGYDRSRISAARTYGVQVRILVDGALWFVNRQPEPVLTRGNPSSAQIIVQPAPSGG